MKIHTPGYNNVTLAHKEKIRKAWEDPEQTTTVLIVLLIDLYYEAHRIKDSEEENPLQWAPDTILSELHSDYRVELPEVNLSKLMAGRQIISSDEFYESLPTFNELCMAMAGHHTPGIFIPADAAECAAGITEALLLSPPDEQDQEPFSLEIRTYLGHVLQDEGILRPPDVLRIAIHNDQLAGKVQTEWSDDPEMFGSIWKAESEKTEDINQYVKSRLKKTFHELGELPLRQGNNKNLSERASRLV